MEVSTFLAAYLLLALTAGSYSLSPPRSLGSRSVTNPAFAHILWNSVSQKDDLVISSFSGGISPDIVSVIMDIPGQVENLKNNKSIDTPQTLLTSSEGFPWPNEEGEVPSDVLGIDNLWWCAVGFLVPGKDDGKIVFVTQTKHFDDIPADKYIITPDQSQEQYKWWYHRAAFMDMNGDGRKDVLTSRAYLNEAGNVNAATAEMVWFEQPATDPLTTKWAEHVLYDGPDAVFRLEKMTANGHTYDVIVSTEYFAEKLVLSWIESNGSWTQPSTIQHLVVDAVVDERYFDSTLVDLNGDDKLDLLVSINSDKNGSLVAYEIPSDFRDGEGWTRHTLRTGFKPQNLFITEGNGAPGMMKVFYPNTNDLSRKKPVIMLSGDDDGSYYLFESSDDSDPNNWNYNEDEFFHARGTVGTMEVMDVDGNGYPEVFLPAYSTNTLHVYTFNP